MASYHELANCNILSQSNNMPYSEFKTIGKVKADFNLTTREGVRFLPDLDPHAPFRDADSFSAAEFALSSSNGQRKGAILLRSRCANGNDYCSSAARSKRNITTTN